MSNAPHSPYSQPVPNAPRGGGGSSKNTVIIVGIVSLTLLLMCGGVLGLGYYAIERLANEINSVNMDYMADDYETPAALEYALEDNERIRDEIGEIESVSFAGEYNESDTYYTDNYYYRVYGSDGDVLVRATISGKEDRRFDRVELIPDETDLETRVELEVRAVPFEDSLSMAAYEAVQDDERVLELTGEIEYVFTDWDLTDEHTGADDPEYVLRVRGEEGSTRLRVRYDDYDYETLERIELFEDFENPVTLMDKNANESEDSNESADGEPQDAS